MDYTYLTLDELQEGMLLNIGITPGLSHTMFIVNIEHLTVDPFSNSIDLTTCKITGIDDDGKLIERFFTKTNVYGDNNLFRILKTWDDE